MTLLTTSLSHTELQELKAKIEDGLEEWSVKTYPSELRNHLGISEIGKNCSRQMFYKFRWMFIEEFNGRMRRLFQYGHDSEARYINYLEGIGCKVYRFDTNGKQFRVSGVMGHYGGSCDGVVITPWYPNIPFICEFKSHNYKSFSNYLDKKVQKAKPQHFDQMCGYGEKMQIEYGLYFPENKNDSDIQVEVIKLDWQRAKQLELKAQDIILAKEPPAKISDNPAFIDCRLCAAKGICHNGEIPLKNCRSCKNSSPIQDAQWQCNLCSMIIPSEVIKIGCEKWMPI